MLTTVPLCSQQRWLQCRDAHDHHPEPRDGTRYQLEGPYPALGRGERNLQRRRVPPVQRLVPFSLPPHANIHRPNPNPDTVFSNTLGEEFVAIAFRAARAADPAAKLYINDYNTDGTNAKSTAMINLVRKLKAAGVPIDGIGVQAHLTVGGISSSFGTNLANFAALGVDVAITELDIRMKMPSSASLLSRQADDYRTIVNACVSVPRCVGITIWDYTDVSILSPALSLYICVLV